METQKPPLAGRENELETLMATLAEIFRNKGSLLLISGEAGIGKTRLLDEFENRAYAAGCSCLIGRCIPGKPSPYLPFIEIVSQYLNNHPSGFVNNLQFKKASIEDIFGTSSSDSSNWNKVSADGATITTNTWFTLLDFFRIASKEQPLVLRIEDLHWADSTSIQILHFLARNISGLGILLLGTYRPEDLWSDRSGSQHPLIDAVRTMKKEGLCEELTLRGLNETEMGCLLHVLLNGQIEPSLFRRLLSDCEGNPLYAVEVCRLLKSENVLEIKDGIWLGTSKDFGIPKMILDVIQSRLDKLSKESRLILEWASIIGFTFDPRIIALAMSMTVIKLFENLEVLESESLIVPTKGQTFQFTHDKIRQAVYDSIKPTKREELHKRIGEILEGSKDVAYGTLATHFFRANDARRCIQYSLMAGDDFSRKGAFTDAKPFYDQVLAMNDGSVMNLQLIAKAYFGLGEVSLDSGNYPEALNLFKKAMDISTDSEIRTKILGKIHACNEFKDALGQEKYYQSVIERYETLGETENAIICLSYLTNVQLTLGHINDAINSSQKGIEMLWNCPSLLAKRATLHQAGMLNFYLGNYEQAIGDLTNSIELAFRSNDLMNASLWATELSFLLDSNNDFDKAYSVAKKGYDAAMDLNIDLVTLNSSAGLLHSCIRSGKMDEAKTLYENITEKMMNFKWGTRSAEHCLVIASLSEMKAMLGESEQSVVGFKNSLRLMKATPNGILLEALVRSWFARILKHQYAAKEAQDQLENAINIFMKIGNSNQAQKLSIEWEKIRNGDM